MGHPLLLALTLCLCLPLTAAADALKVGLMHTEPWGFYGSDGEQRSAPMGIVMEANQAIARESGLSLEPVLVPYGRIGRDLRNGDVDLTYLIRSPDRDAYVEYVGHLFTFQCIVVARPSLPLRRYEDLAGLRIGLIKDIHLNPRFDEDAQLQKVEVKDYETLVDMFLNGRLDAIAGNSVSIPYLLQKRGHVSLAQHPLVLQQTEAWAQLSKRSSHRADIPRLRAAIDKLRNQGYFEEILTRYGALPPSRAAANSKM